MRPMAMAWPRPAAARPPLMPPRALREFAAEDTATVEGSGGKKIDSAEQEVDPDGGAEEEGGREPGALEEVDLGSDRENRGREKKRPKRMLAMGPTTAIFFCTSAAWSVASGVA